MINLDYVKKHRNIPFVKKGMKIELAYDGITKVGKVVGGNDSGNIQVKFEGDKHTENCHPNWAIKYFDNNGNVLAEFKE